ncbi:hypothetical protein DPMN_003100 [Dreissena polymorpha]|uniref:Uncharacterized protein n=1 Tax=Dreissena polymorpha TaxID=45954 RepID=A0A9D4ML91_DREPO|nr:hypothetical protein DPMN_003100 [Dreissena polymorpha]
MPYAASVAFAPPAHLAVWLYPVPTHTDYYNLGYIYDNKGDDNDEGYDDDGDYVDAADGGDRVGMWMMMLVIRRRMLFV